MSVAVYVTKIEMVDPKKAAVSVVIDSDLGRLQLDLSAEASDRPNAILEQVRERLTRFGNELLHSAASLHLSVPPPK